MLKRRLALLAVVLLAIFGLGILFGLLLPRFAGIVPSGPKLYGTAAILRQVKTISELSTVQYIIEKVVILEVPPESMLGQMFAGQNRVLMVAHGIVKAGPDLSQLQPSDIHVSGNTITLKLPRSKITAAYLDESQTRVIERTTGLFRSFDKDLEQNARQTAIDDIRRAARDIGIIKDADERARAQIRYLLEPLGFQVEFKD